MADPSLAGLAPRELAASAVALAYAALSAYWLRPVWRRRSPPRVRGTLIAFASQTGYAAQVAEQTAEVLRLAQHETTCIPLADLTAEALKAAGRVLFIVSTTGEGDAPDSATAFIRGTMDRAVDLSSVSYAVLALGDREYDNYCAFGRALDAWLTTNSAAPMFDRIEVDNGDERALRGWRDQLATAFELQALSEWKSAQYERWRLTSRELLNPGSAGAPCFHLVLEPLDRMPDWQAGDIVEIDPFNSHATDSPLPHREYSIASIPADRAIELVVRQQRGADGRLGVGSGWLTASAQIGEGISLRVRANPGFHAPASDAPVILIGNGTGIAGLRALLKARVARGHQRNWLLFGERNAACDAFFASELRAWQTDGHLPRLDLVYSRDQPERRYVQHRLMECASDIRRWVDEGAHVYVCGSLEGMAPAVHEALSTILGRDMLDDLLSTGRYRRDVY